MSNDSKTTTEEVRERAIDAAMSTLYLSQSMRRSVLVSFWDIAYDRGLLDGRVD